MPFGNIKSGYLHLIKTCRLAILTSATINMEFDTDY